MNNAISIAHYEPLSEVNGPGRRAVLWVQGCPKRCKGCWNPDFLAFKPSLISSVEEVANKILADASSYSLEGITLSGGEPFAQPAPLTKLLSMIKEFGLTTFAFSGYTIAEIRNLGRDATNLLSLLDVLVDGEYQERLKKPLLWRSSQNQVVHFLSERYVSWKGLINATDPEFEVTIDSDSTKLTGFPEKGILKLLTPSRSTR